MHSHKRRILIIDGDAHSLIGFKSVIEALSDDTPIDTTNDGQWALELASRGLDKGHIYSLIFVDEQIKPMSVQLFAAETRKLYKDHPTPHIVAVTNLIEH